MTNTMKFKVGASRTSPKAKIRRVEPKANIDPSKCEGNVNIGVFFDGTNNNYERDKPEFGHTNVARLYDAYRDQKSDGYFHIYVPGVGTPFPELGEKGESALGNGFALGCEERVLYGLCSVFNALHITACSGKALLSNAQIRALCCTQSIHSSIVDRDDYVELIGLGYRTGLRLPDTFGQGERKTILRDLAGKLQAKIISGKPKLKECFIDVFGFSRGAAQARVFCNWLNEILIDGRLAGIPVRFRFLGIMDTVASAGFWSSIIGGLTGGDGGHSGWAEAEHLTIPSSICNCVHMVAVHELRRNFPLDTVTVDGVLPPNCQEWAYPGAHSDVGGGYTPGELGVSTGANIWEGDSLKLSQIPLNHMLECAVAAGAPLDAKRASEGADQPFAVHPRLFKAFDDFVSHSTSAPRPVHDWLQGYLNWRYQIRNDYRHQDQVKLANASDQEILIEHNKRFVRDASLLDYYHSANWVRRKVDPTVQIAGKAVARLDDEAGNILRIAQKAAPTAPALAAIFGGFVHDSLAGFNRAEVEWTGYWRYRKGFLGNRTITIASNDATGDGAQAVA